MQTEKLQHTPLNSDLLGNITLCSNYEMFKMKYKNECHRWLWQRIDLPYRTKCLIGINVREIRDCQKPREVKPTKG